MRIADIKELFLTEAAYQVYSACMYEPTWEKFATGARKLVSDECAQIFGCLDGEDIRGIIALCQRDGSAEIVGIAVSPKCRKRGIGRAMIDFAATRLGALFAETDDDSVGFYQSCGFDAEKFVRTFPDGQCVRYKCARK